MLFGSPVNFVCEFCVAAFGSYRLVVDDRCDEVDEITRATDASRKYKNVHFFSINFF